MTSQKNIALFGATGSSGKEFLLQALKHNFNVKALVRNPDKIEIENSKLQYIKGDFKSIEAIRSVIKNADFVVCMAGSLKSPVKDLMFDFIRILHPLMIQENVANLTYQAGALCYIPRQRKSLVVSLMRTTIGKIAGAEVSLSDHDKVLQYIDNKMIPDGIKVFVTLPGAAGLNSGPSQRELKIQKGVKFSASTFIDVANFTFLNFNNKELHGKFLYIA